MSKAMLEPGEEFYGDAISAEEARARFDRWHAAELRKAKAEAWEEGARAQWGYGQKPIPNEYKKNPYRADEMEGSEHEE